MKRQIVIVACLFLFLLVSTAQAEERYLLVGEIDKGKYYLDTQTILYSNGVYRFWNKNVLSELGRKELAKKQTSPKTKNKAAQTSYEFMCFEMAPRMMEFRVLSCASYNSNRDLLRADTFNTNWEPIIPGTIAEGLFNAVLYIAKEAPELIRVVK